METPEDKTFNARKLELEVQEHWQEVDAYHLVVKHREGGEDYYFNDGPPYTSGTIHLGTAWNKTLKDSMVRYLRMNGRNVRDQPGYDMHGLPIEVRVEKELGFSNKQDIQNFGIDNFVSKCREFALKFLDKMTEQFKSLGVWLDWDNPYMTIRNEYLEAAWWTIKRSAEKDLLTQAQRVLTWCPRCETALAEAEVEYWDETDPSITVKFPLKGRENEYVIIWTTTPWTLPADLCVSVHPDFGYAKLRVTKDGKDEYWWLVGEQAIWDEVVSLYIYGDEFDSAPEGKKAALIQKLHDDKVYEEVGDRIMGQDMEGWEYIHPLLEEVPYHQNPVSYNHCRIVLATYVSAENTGCVHTAPGHGPDDFETGKAYDLPPFCPVDGRGYLTEDAGKYAGRFTKEQDPNIIADLDQKGLLIHSGKITHRYGHCWRCKDPITYRATVQWFLKITEVRDRMLEEISSITWVPKWAGSSRQRDWVENTRDWCISRQRYWGIPIPVWKCDCGWSRVVGNREELNEAEGYTDDMDLHRPWVDKVTFTCPECGTKVNRVPDVLDVWFDSAVCSWAQLGYPARTDEFERWWPPRWIVEAHDQTRGWFYSQLGASVVAFDRIPYQSVLMHGFALAENGTPMSKSTGNVVDPLVVMDKYGADAMRLWFLRTSAPWEDLPFSWEGVRNTHRSLNTYWNVYVFATTYMALDDFDPGKVTLESVKDNLTVEDRWLLSRLEWVKKEVTDSFETRMMHLGCRALEEFIVEDLSRTYVKLVRDRVWVEKDDPGKLACYRTIYEALWETALLMSPVMPHLADLVGRNLGGPGLVTIHTLDWPRPRDELKDTELEGRMAIVRKVVEAAQNAREKGGRKLRWPVKEVIIQGDTQEVVDASRALEPLLKHMTNSKEMRVILPTEEWEGLQLVAEPQMSVLGPAFRGDAKKVGEALERVDPQELKTALDGGAYDLSLDGKTDGHSVSITQDMVRFYRTQSQDVLCTDFPGGMVYIDTHLTPEIESEGWSRELVRRIQDMRKEMDLGVDDRITVTLKAPPRIQDLVRNRLDYISRETRARRLDISDDVTGDMVKNWSIEGEEITLGVACTEG